MNQHDIPEENHSTWIAWAALLIICVTGILTVGGCTWLLFRGETPKEAEIRINQERWRAEASKAFWDRIHEREADISRCRDKGGVPTTARNPDYTNNFILVRCDFPPRSPKPVIVGVER